MRSRLEEKAQKELVRNIILAILGIGLIVGLTLKFGLQFLINLSVTLEKPATTTGQSQNGSNQTYFAPPVVNPLPDATNSAQITVSGYALANEQITLYVNGSVFDKKTVNDDKSFSFDGITLQSGQNDIKAKVTTDSDQQSNYSNDQTITFNNKAPTLSIDSPADGQTIKGDSHVTVSGKTDANVQVTVNDFWAIVDDNGKFTYTLSLQNGDNTIKVVATDGAGNATTKEIKVHYSQ